MRKNTTRFTLLVLAVTAVATTPVLGADALAICNSGQPYLWPGNGAGIPFNPDQGDLRDDVPSIDNATGVALVQAAFDNWTGLGANVSYTNAGPLPVDVDITNFGPYLDPVAPDGFSAIVFDADGQIFDLLFGPGSGILGFAGPEWVAPPTCEILEGVSFLNGPSFDDLTAAEDVMTHEFGHYSNLGHVELNGQLVTFSEGGDDSGPSPDNTTFGTPGFVGTEVIETMYPFYFGPVVGTLTPHADDIASMATLYPDATFFADSGSIQGTIFAPDGTTPVSGVNVIARNVADPFVDSVSTFSGAYTDSTDPSDPNVGIYQLNNLTPGATYAVFIDAVTAQAGRFSNPIALLLGPEEWYDANESSSNPPDDPQASRTDITVDAGNPVTGIDIIFNQPAPGDPLAVGDDGFVNLSMPFSFEICGQSFNSVFVNANGNITFGAASTDFSESAGEFLAGPPRIAGLWDDLNPSAGGAVFYGETKNTFTVTWQDVPEFFATGANTFAIKLKKASSQVTVSYGDLGATDGLAGVSCGIAATGGLESETELVTVPKSRTINFNGETAVFELFSGDNDLDGYTLKYNTTKHELQDAFEPNDSPGAAAAITLPFNTAPNSSYTSISPAAADIDWFTFSAEANQTFVAEVERGQIDSVLGLFDSSGSLVAFNDDANGLLSRIQTVLPADDTYYLAVTFCCDYDFDGVDPGQGLPFDHGRYVLDAFVIDGVLLSLGDDSSAEVSFGFDFPTSDSRIYNSVFVNSNGNLTFGSGDSDFSESVGEFANEGPRIAALWDDLSPNNGGLVFYKEEADSLAVTFLDVPEFLATGANNFTVTLSSTGDVSIEYGNVTASDGLAGATLGAGVATAVDMSATGGGSVTNGDYELFDFANVFDLANTVINFIP